MGEGGWVDTRRRVAIVHPWFPQYRVEFFAKLRSLASDEHIDLRIFHGDPSPEWLARGDAREGGGATRLETRFYKLGSRHLALKSLREFRRQGPYDLIILEQAIRNLETYPLMMQYGPRIAWWGHGRTYTAAKSAWEERAKTFLTNRGRWFFAYTRSGAEAVTANGFDAGRTTVVNNSTDVSGLAADVQAASPEAVKAFMAAHGLTDSSVLYLGGLDPDKRVDLLLRSALLAHDADSRFRMVVVGAGELRSEVETFSKANPWLVYLGPLFGAARALPMRSTKLLAIPGRVGLVAVDSFAAQLPIITTDWPYHAPEFDYLAHQHNAIVTEDSAESFSRGMLDVLQNENLRTRLVDGCRDSAGEYGVDRMAENFCEGIIQALAPGDRRRSASTAGGRE